jgi:hypothetical protein
MGDGHPFGSVEKDGLAGSGLGVRLRAVMLFGVIVFPLPVRQEDRLRERPIIVARLVPPKPGSLGYP